MIQYQALIPSVDPYLAAVVTLSRSALGVVGVVMMHLTKPQGLTDLPTEAAEIARAARDVGVRVGFAIAIRERNPLIYAPSEQWVETPPAARARADRRPAAQAAIAQGIHRARRRSCRRRGRTDVRCPVRPQRGAMVQRRASFDDRRGVRRTGCGIHGYLLEKRYQRAWADTTHPDGIVKHLERALPAFSLRLTLAHCVWARPNELELLAERGVTIAMNTSSNLHLRSGIAPAARMLETGCRIAIGLDFERVRRR